MTKTAFLVGGIGLGAIVLFAGIRVALLLHDVGSYRKYWQQEAAQKSETGSVTYVALGDSAAQGIGASSARNGYVGLVAKYLAQTTGKQVHVVNLSVSGAKIQDAIDKQLPNMVVKTADYVTIEIGVNNMDAYEKTKFEDEFSELIKLLPAGAYVANMPSFNGGRKGHVNPSAVSASKIIEDLLMTRPELRKVDLYGATIDQGILDFGADLLHPSNRGYKNWAKAFTDSIKASLPN